MRSGTPALVGFLVLLGAAFWFDAHAGEIAGGLGAASGTSSASEQLVSAGK